MIFTLYQGIICFSFSKHILHIKDNHIMFGCLPTRFMFVHIMLGSLLATLLAKGAECAKGCQGNFCGKECSGTAGGDSVIVFE